jgi:hypothetical protein
MVAPQSSSWVHDRLVSWAEWLRKDPTGRGYGQSSLTLDEYRTLPVRAFVPTFEHECEQVQRAVLKLPMDMRKVAMGFYVDQITGLEVGRRINVSRAQAFHMRKTLHVMVRYCLENQHVKDPPWHLLLKVLN